jgi:hypothetical protein
VKAVLRNVLTAAVPALSWPSANQRAVLTEANRRFRLPELLANMQTLRVPFVRKRPASLTRQTQPSLKHSGRIYPVNVLFVVYLTTLFSNPG